MMNNKKMEQEEIARYFKEANLIHQISLFDLFRQQADTKPIFNYTENGWLLGHNYEMPFLRKVEFFNILRERGYRLAEKVIANSFVAGNNDSVRLTGLNLQAQVSWKDQWKPLLQSKKACRQREIKDDWFDARCITYKLNQQGQNAPCYNESMYRTGRFEAAVWKGNTLCGLAYGGKRGYFRESVVGVHLLEGHPDSAHPLKGKIFDIMLIAAAAYAEILGHDRVLLKGPFSKGSLQQAEKLNLILKKELWGQRLLSKYEEGWIPHPDIYVQVKRVIHNTRYMLNSSQATPT
jgi:hypothetical protein